MATGTDLSNWPPARGGGSPTQHRQRKAISLNSTAAANRPDHFAVPFKMAGTSNRLHLEALKSHS